jgi:acetyl-CoA acyltransferase
VLGYFRAFVSVGVDPSIMGIGPLPAVQKLLAKTGLSLDAIDLVEMNEAFGSQAVYCQRQLGIPDEKLNVNGGAIALGHPLGCTGAKLVATALHELKRRGGRYAIITMCIGGGMGAAGLVEPGSALRRGCSSLAWWPWCSPASGHASRGWSRRRYPSASWAPW